MNKCAVVTKAGVEEGESGDKIQSIILLEFGFDFGGACLGSIGYLLYKKNKMKETVV